MGHLTEAQQEFLLVFCCLSDDHAQQDLRPHGYDTLAEYALEALREPLYPYDPQEGRYELHSIPR